MLKTIQQNLNAALNLKPLSPTVHRTINIVFHCALIEFWEREHAFQSCHCVDKHAAGCRCEHVTSLGGFMQAQANIFFTDTKLLCSSVFPFLVLQRPYIDLRERQAAVFFFFPPVHHLHKCFIHCLNWNWKQPEETHSSQHVCSSTLGGDSRGE